MVTKVDAGLEGVDTSVSSGLKAGDYLLVGDGDQGRLTCLLPGGEPVGSIPASKATQLRRVGAAFCRVHTIRRGTPNGGGASVIVRWSHSIQQKAQEVLEGVEEEYMNANPASYNREQLEFMIRREQLEALVVSEELRATLRDERLQKTIRRIDASEDPEMALEQELHANPAFKDFTDRLIDVVEPAA